MSPRARAAAYLAWHLTETTAVPVHVNWDRTAGGPSGVWRVEWTDGPTTDTMRRLVAERARRVQTLDATALRYGRRFTTTAWAAALIAMAERGDLPDNATEAETFVEFDLHDTDATAWQPHWLAAADLARLGEHHPRLMAEVLIAARVTKPRNETSPPGCRYCGTALPGPAGIGRPRQWCSSACRQAARRAAGTVTKPRHETSCAACDEPLTPTASPGRPRRWCSPACRTRGWRTGGGTH